MFQYICFNLDAEEFATKQMHKFMVTFSNSNEDSNDPNRSRSAAGSNIKKNVSFNDRNNYTLNVSAGTIDDSTSFNNYGSDDTNRFSSASTMSASTRPILKSSALGDSSASTSNINRLTSTPRAIDSYTGRSSIGYGSGSSSYNEQSSQQDNNNLLITANSNNNAKKAKADGYEILVFQSIKLTIFLNI